MPDILDWLTDNFSIPSDLLVKILLTAGAAFSIWLLRRWLLKVALQRVTDPKRRYNLQRNSAYLAFFLAFVAAGLIWLENASQIATYLGLLSAGLAVALREPLINLIGWAYILWQRPFNIGDRIQVGENAGDVIDIDPFQIVLMEIGNWVHADQSTGRIIHVPNGKVLTEPLANYTEEFNYIWNEISITITFESDWQKAKGLLQVIADRHSAPTDETGPAIQEPERQKYYYFYTHLTPTVYTSIQDSGVCLSIRYLCKPRNRRHTEQAIQENILHSFDQHEDIQLAYPTRREIVNLRQRAPQTKPEPPEEDTPASQSQPTK
jgi:small-conductance mechanosensitive channel